MKLVKDAIAYINPGQTPVSGMDQPLYALTKQIQWERADAYGESSYVVMMGGLHIEMASLKMVGHWLNNSGWDSALVQAGHHNPWKGRCYTEGGPHYQVSLCTSSECMRTVYLTATSLQGKHR